MTKPRVAPGAARRAAEVAIRRHEASDLEAYIAFDPDAVRRRAEALDDAVAAGADPGPLAGVTVSVKDLYALDGYPLRAGTPRPLPAWPEGFLVRALRRLGAVFTGKTHTVEFAFGAVGLNPHTGTPINPWDANAHRAPGGSSAGAGVSLWGGVGAARPRHGHGRIDPHPRLGDRRGGVPSHDGTLAHDGRGSAQHDARHGGAARAHGEGRAVRLPARLTPWRRPSARPRRLRRAGRRVSGDGEIGVPSSRLWTDAEAGIAVVVEGALGELAAAGATLVDVDAPELDEAGRRYFDGRIVQPEFLAFLERELPEWIPLLAPIVGKRLGAVGKVRALDHISALHERRRLSAAVHARLAAERIDVLAAPTLPIAPPPLSALARLAAYREANRRMLSGTCPASMLDLCAVTLPAGLDGDGMPVGLQLMGPSGSDLELLARAAAAESILGDNIARLGTPPRIAE